MCKWQCNLLSLTWTFTQLYLWNIFGVGIQRGSNFVVIPTWKRCIERSLWIPWSQPWISRKWCTGKSPPLFHFLRRRKDFYVQPNVDGFLGLDGLITEAVEIDTLNKAFFWMRQILCCTGLCYFTGKSIFKCLKVLLSFFKLNLTITYNNTT